MARSVASHPKIKTIIFPDRQALYSDLFGYANKNLPGKIVVVRSQCRGLQPPTHAVQVQNADIWLGEGFQQLERGHFDDG